MVKEKPGSTRIYDEDGFRRRAACICVRNDSENEVLLVTSSRRPDHWIVPGGGVEPEEEPSVTAIREVVEEAGVLGKLDRCLGVFENDERKHRTEVFVMVVTEELPEWEDSRSIVFGDAVAVDLSWPARQSRSVEYLSDSTVLGSRERSPVLSCRCGHSHRTKGRQRKWFTLDEALKQLSLHKPMQLTYLESLRTRNMT